MPKVTVYIPCCNYGRYLDRAVQSVLNQSMKDWELIIIDDGSTDNTQEVLQKYKDHPSTVLITQENQGLTVANNVAIRLSRGKYLMRLDPDDYLDENCLLVLSNILDTKPDIGLVYPDYYHVDENDDILEIVRRKKIGEEVELLDLPAHGACSMIRKQVLVNLGSYDEELTCQDGYDLWLRLIQRYKPYNVNIPLFYYRQHPLSLTRNKTKILDTRREIKRRFIERNGNGSRLRVLGVVPVLSSSVYSQNRPFVSLADKPLLWYTLSEAVKAVSLERLVLAAEDEETLSYVREYFPTVHCFKRTGKLSLASSRLMELILEVLKDFEIRENSRPDAVCTLYISTPLRKAKHIDQAVDMMTIFNVDSVISIQEELAPCYHHEKYGLTPINVIQGQARLERKTIFKGNGAILLHRSEVVENGQTLGQRVGHITMLPEESVKINTDFEFWLADKILREFKEERR